MSGRIRTIKPEWLEDELLALASSDARTLSIALMLLADDFGNGRANPLQLAGQVFPGKVPETAANALEELRAIRFAILYEVDGQRYFAIRNWSKHQRVDKIGKPRVPGPKVATAIIAEEKQSGVMLREPPAKVPETLDNIPASRASEVVVGVLERGPDPGPDRARRIAPFTASLAQGDPADVAVLKAWQERFQKTDVVLTADRTLHIAERRAEGMTHQDALDALEGAAAEPWFVKQGAKVSLVFNDRERFEVYRDRGRAIREGKDPDAPRVDPKRADAVARRAAAMKATEAKRIAELNAAASDRGPAEGFDLKTLIRGIGGNA